VYQRNNNKNVNRIGAPKKSPSPRLTERLYKAVASWLTLLGVSVEKATSLGGMRVSRSMQKKVFAHALFDSDHLRSADHDGSLWPTRQFRGLGTAADNAPLPRQASRGFSSPRHQENVATAISALSNTSTLRATSKSGWTPAVRFDSIFASTRTLTTDTQ
jgi:methylmalonyl-CoA mutase N-terminal domain/subunit